MLRFLCTRSIPLCVLLLFTALQVQAQAVIQGTLVGHDGQPLAYAHVRIVGNAMSFPRTYLREVAVNEKGAFSTEVSAPGLFRFWFTGPNHKRLEVPIYVPGTDTIEVNVHLGHSPIKAEIDTVWVTWADSLRPSGSVGWSRKAMEKNDQGVFQATIHAEADTLAFALRKINEEGGSVAGWNADEFRPDRNGRYDAIVHTKAGSLVTITFDPTDVPAFSKTTSTYEVVRAPQETYTFFDVHEDLEARSEKARLVARKQSEQGIPTYNQEKYDWEPDLKELKRLIRREKDPFKKQIRYIAYLRAGMAAWWGKKWDLDRKLAKNMLRDVPPDSPLWSYWPFVGSALSKASDPAVPYREDGFRTPSLAERKRASKPYRSYVEQLISQPDSTLYPTMLKTTIGWAHRNGYYEMFSIYYSQAMDELKGRDLKQVIDQYAGDSPIQPGVMVPDFDFVSLDDESVHFTRDRLKGKTYLINFWATWCAACVEKMEALNKIHETYKDEAFELVSVSINFREEDAHQFRKEKYAMPWFNTHIKKWKPDKGVLKDFHVYAIPLSILVDQNGLIIATSKEGDDAFYDVLMNHMGR